MREQTNSKDLAKRREAERLQSLRRLHKRYGSEREVYALTGILPRTLQKHRLFGKGFPFYRVGGRVLYDLDEIDQTIQAGRVGA